MYVADRATGGTGKSPDEEPILKRCTRCGVEKPLSAYDKKPGGRFGRNPRCKQCRRPIERARSKARRDEQTTPPPIPDTGSIVKRCTKCKVEKPLSAYGKQKGGLYGLHPRCKECRQAQERERYAANREEILAKQKANPNRAANWLRNKRRKKYGMTDELLKALVSLQEGRCAVCGEPVEPLCVDHDHETGIVRGLLCSPCNIGLGHLKDDPERLLAAVAYLRDPPALKIARITPSVDGAMAESG